MEHNITYAIAAIERLNNRRMGIKRFDHWINFAIKDWHDFINEQMQGVSQ